MKRYGLILGGLLILVALLGIPPRPYTRSWMWSTQPHRTPERLEATERLDDLLRDSWLYQRIRWRDSVSTRLQRTDPTQTPVLLQVPEFFPDTLLGILERGTRLHLEDLGLQAPEVPVGIFFIPQDYLEHPRALDGRHWRLGNRREIYVAREGEPPFCALVEPVDERGTLGLATTVNRLAFVPSDSRLHANTLRICGYFARYGPPGREVATWLRKTGSTFGSGVSRRLAVLDGDLGSNPRGVFGKTRSYSPITLLGLSCLSGDASSCRSTFMGASGEPQWWDRRPRETRDLLAGGPVDFFDSWWVPYGHFGPMDGFVFRALEEDFGPDRFRTFWTSDLPVEEAFNAAFGTPVDRWVMAWAKSYYGEVRTGPSLPLSASLYTYLTLGLLGAFGLWTGRRRG